jgi:hypothetical protein
VQKLLTYQVAEREGIPIKKIWSVLSQRLISPPERDRSGRYLWAEGDIARLREVALVDRRLRMNRAKPEATNGVA